MRELDTKNLIAELGSKHCIRIDESDPALTIVALNRLVLEKSTEQITEQVRVAMREFEEAVGKVQRRAGHLMAEEFNDRVSALRNELQKDITLAGAKANEFVFRVEQANRQPIMFRWGAAGAISGLFLFVAGLWIGIHYLHS